MAMRELHENWYRQLLAIPDQYLLPRRITELHAKTEKSLATIATGGGIRSSDIVAIINLYRSEKAIYDNNSPTGKPKVRLCSPPEHYECKPDTTHTLYKYETFDWNTVAVDTPVLITDGLERIKARYRGTWDDDHINVILDSTEPDEQGLHQHTQFLKTQARPIELVVPTA